MFALGAIGLALIALFVAMGASGKADAAARRLRALESRLNGPLDAAEGGGGEIPSLQRENSEAG